MSYTFDLNVSCSSCWGYSLINTLKLKKYMYIHICKYVLHIIWIEAHLQFGALFHVANSRLIGLFCRENIAAVDEFHRLLIVRLCRVQKRTDAQVPVCVCVCVCICVCLCMCVCVHIPYVVSSRATSSWKSHDSQ